MNEEKDKACLDLENNSKYCFFKVANAFLLLANLLLIILGFHYLPTCLSEDSSYFSVIVAVLGILVTVLITWQIWQTIASREEIKEAHKEVENIKEEVEKYKNGTETKITNLKTELDKLNDQFTNKLNLHEIHHRGLLKRIQGESQFADSDFINACISFADAANDYIDSQSNHATHISPCANWIRRCIQSIHDIPKSDVPSVNDAIRRIDILLSKINSTTSVLKEERMALSHSKEQLEILINRATSTES